MAAVIGAEENVVRGFAADMDVDIANLNAPGQVVISGEQERIAMAIAMAREAGVRKIVPLNVAGAYHSRLMEPAYLKLGKRIDAHRLPEADVPGDLERRCPARGRF